MWRKIRRRRKEESNVKEDKMSRNREKRKLKTGQGRKRTTRKKMEVGRKIEAEVQIEQCHHSQHRTKYYHCHTIASL